MRSKNIWVFTRLLQYCRKLWSCSFSALHNSQIWIESILRGIYITLRTHEMYELWHGKGCFALCYYLTVVTGFLCRNLCVCWPRPCDLLDYPHILPDGLFFAGFVFSWTFVLFVHFCMALHDFMKLSLLGVYVILLLLRSIAWNGFFCLSLV